MSAMSDLAYDIEQLYIEGYSPKSIAVQLGCPLLTVYEWIEAAGLAKEEQIDPEEWDQAFGG